VLGAVNFLLVGGCRSWDFVLVGDTFQCLAVAAVVRKWRCKLC